MPRFLKQVLIVFAVLLLLLLVIYFLAGDGGVIPFQYDGFG